MRHNKKSVRLNRSKAKLKALKRSLLTSVILYEDIETTRDKAKFVRGVVDRIIVRAKKAPTQKDAIRYIKKYVFEKNASVKIMKDLVERFKNRSSGFTRFVNTRVRKGDGTQMVRFQLLDN